MTSEAINRNTIILDKETILLKRNEILNSSDEAYFIDILKDEELRFKKNKNDMSYLSGGSGLVFIFINLFESTKDKSYLKKGKELVLNNYESFLNNKYVGSSLYNGKSGLLLTTLYLYLLYKDKELISVLEKALESIFKDCVLNEDNYPVWYNPLQFVAKPLCSFGYGIAGIAYTLLIVNSFIQSKILLEVIEKINDYIFKTLGEDIDLKCDFRKEVKSLSDIERYESYLENENFDAFEDGIENHSIEHGKLGILFYLKFYKNELLDLKTSFESEKINEQKLITESTLQYIVSKEDIKKHKSFLLPYFRHLAPQKLDGLGLTLDSKLYELIIANNYKITFSYLKSLDEDFKFRNLDVDIDWLIDKASDENHKTNIKVNYEYDKELIYQKSKTYLRTSKYISYIHSQDRIMQSLSIADTELINQKLVFTKENEIKNFFSNTEGKISKHSCLWQYSIDSGIEAYQLDMMSFIIFRFKKVKSIKQALYEMLVFCKLTKQKKLKPLIDFSNSKDKNDFIQRFPFLFIYQIRLFIKDGILEEAKKESQKSTIKTSLLSLVLKCLRVNVATQISKA